ncbi:hypothetical protein BJ508DRAFT_312658 [Ascobolus immersus RN42]|uniref:Uncharacterized protein n=1 Tax=Ascobolus immersus RN42 TaxID=1160509 RepID=A0A3N4HN41_ASCIM|nr:hypothetical protein BJ508DRAFT_312658 [Ascobolus immersus RN42]
MPDRTSDTLQLRLKPTENLQSSPPFTIHLYTNTTPDLPTLPDFAIETLRSSKCRMIETIICTIDRADGSDETSKPPINLNGSIARIALEIDRTTHLLSYGLPTLRKHSKMFSEQVAAIFDKSTGEERGTSQGMTLQDVASLVARYKVSLEATLNRDENLKAEQWVQVGVEAEEMLFAIVPWAKKMNEKESILSWRDRLCWNVIGKVMEEIGILMGLIRSRSKGAKRLLSK